MIMIDNTLRVQQIENNTPRKIIGYQMANEAFDKEARMIIK